MGLTYDGITYRSLEEQVRYDAEQVQLLKQADVTINENLQTINTEIDGKLTKPTNPSAESAVTMLADGTVGTKPLSEIGGGGKLYKHRIQLMSSDSAKSADINIINSRGTAYPINTPADIDVIFNEQIDKYFISGYVIDNNAPVLNVTTAPDGQYLRCFATNDSDRFITLQCCMGDTVTEL